MERKTIRTRSHAKLNLSLEVLGKRADGYHEIRSLMVPIELFDDITMDIVESGIECVCDNADVPSGEENLAYKAVELFLRESGMKFGVKLKIAKNIPVGAGLGGGSGNAGIVLKELNALCGEIFDGQRLEELASRLGSDVPFFLREGAQWATGRGEKLTPAPELPDWHYVIIYPGVKISSKWAYSNLPLTINDKKNNIYYFKVGEFELKNHLELAVMGEYPIVGVLKERLLESGAVAALMTGSGSAVYGVFEEREVAEGAYEYFRHSPAFRVFLTRELRKRL